MAEIGGRQPGELRTLVVGFSLADRYVQRLRSRFPDLRVVVAEDGGLHQHLAEADALVAWHLTADELEAAPRLKWFQTIGAGVDSILIPELLERGILLTNNSGVHAINIAEHVMGMMLALARRLPFLIRAQSQHVWRDDDGRHGVFELAGQTLLVVGVGDIGQAVALRARAFGMAVLGVRRRRGQVVPAGFSTVLGIDELRAALARADQVAICLPLTAETRGLFDTAALAAMRQGAYLYNIGRGPIVDTAALVASLQSGHLGGAGLDVTDPEPLPADSPLWNMANVIITAHTAGATPRYWDRAIEILETNVERFRAGEPLLNLVDQRAGY